MTNGIESLMQIEKERNAFYNRFNTYEITDIRLDLNKANRACYKALGDRSFTAAQFVRKEANGMWFKRENDAEEAFIKNCWIKNIDDVERFVKAYFQIEEPKLNTVRMHYGEYKKNYAEHKTVKGSYDAATKTIEVIM